MQGSVEICAKFAQNCLLVMLRENMAVVRLLKWLEVKDERIKNFIFHDFYRIAGEQLLDHYQKSCSPAIGSRSRPVLKD
jgi:hypothetical protein